ncbi:polyprenyl synthetase family protein [Streptomyces sp. CB01881]|uniref:polyprenyl synthetase family protein n=1 Tax=Streptomyces sp. CB01881 TaxID=2078691 RepID=UPI000CDBA9DB|nr:polyprenyl synthetase family protein [Streptomyces sp. CB01881]AUY53114.1 geranylgeranyl diphosphate synthase [Streptomyces sp. CB01881]TYC69266.1 polyprenyl synthetase family protein [Streptomyces sp. CB01881]
MTTLDVPPVLDPSGIRSAVDELLHTFLDEQDSTATGPELLLFTRTLRDLLDAGGKRLRPVLCVTGWQAVSHEPPPPVVIRAAASLELFHVFALIHDDIMDNSATRRGRPTAHRVLAGLNRHHPRAEALGANAAILLGDLTLGWSYDLLYREGSAEDRAAIPWAVLNAMRTETLVGQYLDLQATGHRVPDVDAVWRVIRYKTAKYTFERPLQLGAMIGGADDGQLRALSDYALPVGEAFQLRDDLLGVFGNPDHTGKPALDDLREGKHTVLVTTAYELATPAQAGRLDAHLGDPELSHEAAEEVRAVLVDTGAVGVIEQMIADRRRRAVDSLAAAPLHSSARAVLDSLAAAATTRIA